MRDKADFTIYTPGSQAGVPLNIVGSLQRPAGDADPEIVGDEVEGFVSGLLSLVGIEADPLSSREHILLANLIQHAWSNGASLDLAALVGQVQDPPLEKLGVLDLDSFFPAKDRTELALRAKGMLMQRRGVGEEEAYRLLRKVAMDRQVKIADVARDLIALAELL